MIPYINESTLIEYEKRFLTKLPEPYKQFILREGSYSNKPVRIFGLGEDKNGSLNVFEQKIRLVLVTKGKSKNLIPIEDLGEGWFACLLTEELQTSNDQVYIWNVFRPEVKPVPWGVDFDTYLVTRKNEIESRKQSWPIYKHHVERFIEKFKVKEKEIGKLPRAHHWQPRRICSQNAVLSLTVLRHSVEDSSLEVDVFLAANVPQFAINTGTRSALVSLVSDSYKWGGSLTLRFTKNVEGGRVPLAIQILASRIGVNLSASESGLILPDETRELFLRMADFSEECISLIYELENCERLKLETACFARFNGIWSKKQLEMIIKNTDNPEKILSGTHTIDEPVLFQADFAQCCDVELLGLFENYLLSQKKDLQDTDGLVKEDDRRNIEITFDQELQLNIFTNLDSATARIEWSLDDLCLSNSESLALLIRARDASQLRFYLKKDIKFAGSLKNRVCADYFAILLPLDFSYLSEKEQNLHKELAANADIKILVAPFKMAAIAKDISRKLEKSRLMRQG
ncbi:MAG: SMI1/KNR4 family protein [Thaumarchaeota archaeon]|nr:SMI1/KNR4 family protein [Nitrososphaerota archaeon]